MSRRGGQFNFIVIILTILLFEMSHGSVWAAAVAARRRQAAQQQQAALMQQARRQQQVAQQQVFLQQRVRQQKGMTQKMLGQQMAMRQAQAIAQRRNRNSSIPIMPSSTREVVEEVVDLDVIWDEMEYSSHIWSRMLDAQPKEMTLERYIEAYRKQGIFIRKPVRHYVRMIDDMQYNNPMMLDHAFVDVLRVVATIEYDFDNGQDKDQMALAVLGQQAYESNRKRLGR